MSAPDRQPDSPVGDDDRQRRRRERDDLVRLAHARLEDQAYARHRDQWRQAHGAGPAPNRGPAGCLALVVVPLGLLLLTVHPLPGMLVLSVGALLYLVGSYQLDRSRRLLEEADAEAEERWRAADERRRQSP